MYVLGEAYAFGVVWSFAFKSLAMFVLRYKQPDAPTREWKVPLNPTIGGREFPLGLGLITVVLFVVRVHQPLHERDGDDFRRRLHGRCSTLMFVVSERATHNGARPTRTASTRISSS